MTSPVKFERSGEQSAMSWDVGKYNLHASYVYQIGERLLEALDPRPGENILDLGCGDGTVSGKIVERGARVRGVDASPEMVGTCLKKGIDALVADAHNLSFEAGFDAVFSNAALHWMKRPGDVIRGVFRALKSEGRFVGEFGAWGNVRKITEAIADALKQFGLDYGALNPWYFPSRREYKKKLEDGGFAVEYIRTFPRSVELPTGITGWLETFAFAFLKEIAEEERESFLKTVVENTRPALMKPGGIWHADYVRCRFKAVKP